MPLLPVVSFSAIFWSRQATCCLPHPLGETRANKGCEWDFASMREGSHNWCFCTHVIKFTVESKPNLPFIFIFIFSTLAKRATQSLSIKYALSNWCKRHTTWSITYSCFFSQKQLKNRKKKTLHLKGTPNSKRTRLADSAQGRTQIRRYNCLEAKQNCQWFTLNRHST